MAITILVLWDVLCDVWMDMAIAVRCTVPVMYGDIVEEVGEL